MHGRFALGVAALIVGPLAVADDFYIGGSVGVSVYDDTAETAIPSPVGLGELPDEISLNGRRFDSNETALGITIGWNANDWLSVELGYTDLGNTGQGLPTAFFSTTPIVSPAAPPLPVRPNIGGILTYPISSIPFAAALDVEEWSIAAKFRKSLISELSANWSVGVTRASFDAEGRLTINEVVTFNPLVLNRVDLPYASPKDETGYRFGFGFDWRFGERFSADIGYRRHDTRVIDVESVVLQLIVTL